MVTLEELVIILKAQDHATAVIKGINVNLKDLSRTMADVGQKMTMFATLPIAAGLGYGVKAASDLNESMNKTQVVFGNNSKAIQAWASNSARDFGLSKAAALDAAGGFGAMFKTMGLGQKDMKDMSTKLVQLAADMGSLYNVDPSEMLLKLRAGLVGEAEPLRTVGILLNEQAVAAKAAEMGYSSNSKELTEAQKVQARYAIILDQSKVSTGDFKNTSDAMANSMRIAKAEFTDAAAALGTSLLPAVTEVLHIMTNLAEAVTKLPEPLRNAAVGGLLLVAAIGPILKIASPLVMILGPMGFGLFGVAAAETAAGTAGATAAPGLWAFASAMIAAAAPILALVAALGAVAVIAILAKGEIDKERESVGQAEFEHAKLTTAVGKGQAAFYTYGDAVNLASGTTTFYTSAVTKLKDEYYNLADGANAATGAINGQTSALFGYTDAAWAGAAAARALNAAISAGAITPQGRAAAPSAIPSMGIGQAGMAAQMAAGLGGGIGAGPTSAEQMDVEARIGAANAKRSDQLSKLQEQYYKSPGGGGGGGAGINAETEKYKDLLRDIDEQTGKIDIALRAVSREQDGLKRQADAIKKVYDDQTEALQKQADVIMDTYTKSEKEINRQKNLEKTRTEISQMKFKADYEQGKTGLSEEQYKKKMADFDAKIANYDEQMRLQSLQEEAQKLEHEAQAQPLLDEKDRLEKEKQAKLAPIEAEQKDLDERKTALDAQKSVLQDQKTLIQDQANAWKDIVSDTKNATKNVQDYKVALDSLPSAVPGTSAVPVIPGATITAAGDKWLKSLDGKVSTERTLKALSDTMGSMARDIGAIKAALTGGTATASTFDPNSYPAEFNIHA